MATKPTTLPRWAETAAGVKNTSEIVEPSSGKKDIGWEDGELPPHETFNWWQNNVYDWVEYLDDGDLSGNHTITGTLDVTGAVGLSALLTAGGGITVPSPQVLTATNPVLKYTTDQSLPLNVFGGVLTVGTAAAPGVTATGNRAVRVGELGAEDQEWTFAIPLEPGKRLKRVDFYGQRVTGTITLRIVEKDRSTGADADVQTASIAAGTSYTVHAVTPASPYTAATTDALLAVVTCTGGADFILYDAVAIWDLP